MAEPSPPAKKARKEDEKQNERQEILRVVQRQWNRLADFPEYWDDKEVCRAAIHSNPKALEFASARLRNERELAAEAAEINCSAALPFISDELKDDAEFCLSLLGSSCCQRHRLQQLNVTTFLAQISMRLRGNREIVLQAIQINGCVLQHASQELCGDREIVLFAVQKHGEALQFASTSLRGDKEVVLAAIQNRLGQLDNMGRPAYHAQSLFSAVSSEELRDNQEIVAAALQGHGYEIAHISERLQNSPPIAASALRNLQTIYRNRVGEVQEWIQQDGHCTVLKGRLAKLKAMLKGRKFPIKHYNPRRMTPQGFAKRLLADTVHQKWCTQQIVKAHGLPTELANRMWEWSGSTTDDAFVASEIADLAPFLLEASDKFHPRFASWWVFLTGKCTGWFENIGGVSS